MKRRLVWHTRSADVGTASLISVVLVLSLSGCWTLPNQLQGPLAIRLDDGVFSLAVCEDITASGISARVSRMDPNKPFWDVESATVDGVALTRGAIIDSKNIGDYFSNVTENSKLLMGPDSGMLVFVKSVNGVGENLSGAFRLHGRTDTDGKWFHPDETLTTEPCV